MFCERSSWGVLSLAALLGAWAGKSGEGEGSGSPAWAGQVDSANLEMPWPLAAGTGAPAHSSRARLAGQEPS